uniref:Uncharacterized protein n=1 Tax=Oryza barthii TaxID=65489 RepID=A0A0D3H0W9_9ORYZ
MISLIRLINRGIKLLQALFGWAVPGRDRGPIPMDHPGEEKIPTHAKLCVRLSPAVDFSPAHHGVSLFSRPGNKSSPQAAWKFSSRRRRRDGGGCAQRDPEATATARRSPPAAIFSPVSTLPFSLSPPLPKLGLGFSSLLHFPSSPPSLVSPLHVHPLELEKTKLLLPGTLYPLLPGIFSDGVI